MLGIVVLITLGAIGGLWWTATASREIARAAAKRACRNGDVQLLDDAVVLERVRLKRASMGMLALYLGYGFEFSSDGVQRYKGYIHMLGRQVQKVEMDVYRSAAN